MKQIVAQLIKGEVMSIEPIEGGRNSKVYRVTAGDSKNYLLKAYFRPFTGDSNRMRNEFSSLSFLWENGIRNIPQPLGADWEHGCALYEYIEGKRIVAEEIGDREIETAVKFLVDLKELRDRARGYNFQPASEACFSIQAIADNIQQRLSLLISQPTNEEPYEALNEFLNQNLTPKLKEILRWCQANSSQADISFELEIDPAERTLSPSDFGFHNALKRFNGQLIFLDFEYFGWDDPGKMVVDVVLHPGMNLTRDMKRRFVHGILKSFSEYPKLAKRIEIVYPLFGIKWCLILLNEFLPEHLLRRRFATGSRLERKTIQAEQLAKARHMLQTISETYENFPYTG
jgi:hypothetical protein